MIAMTYTGDVRHNQKITKKNHELLLKKLNEICPVNVYSFTREDPNRGNCPYDPEGPDPDNKYRRGQGGAIQVWDFMRAVQRTDEEIIMRVRTDLWFTPSSIDVICEQVKKFLDNEMDICYLGSDWINENAGKVNDVEVISPYVHTSVQDFVVIARRSALYSFDKVMERINLVNPNKRRSGNKIFRYIYDSENKDLNVFRVLCQIWLIRQTYKDYPDDNIVCRDYIQSYIADDKAKLGKKSLRVPHPMQDAVNWWRKQMNYPQKDITFTKNLSTVKEWQEK